MGHEVLVWGIIEGATYTRNEYRLLQERNATVIDNFTLADDDEWPWLNRSMFGMPGPYPSGTYRNQVIHFGASLKDDPFNDAIWNQWLSKFEKLLRQLYWYRASVIIDSELEPTRLIEWVATQAAIDIFNGDSPMPVKDWTRHEIEIPSTFA